MLYLLTLPIMRMSIIRTETEIPASAEEVWTVLTDFNSYPEWNVYSNRISGSPMSRFPFIAWDFTFPDIYLPYLMIIKNADFPNMVQFQGIGLPEFVFYNLHEFRIQNLSGKSVIFSHTVNLSGLLNDLIPPESLKEVELNHQEMNEALKNRVLKLRLQ